MFSFLKAELADASVDNVAAGWGDDPYAEPPAAEKMCMAVFAKRARLENAVVFLATHGGYGEDGELQVRAAHAHGVVVVLGAFVSVTEEGRRRAS